MFKLRLLLISLFTGMALTGLFAQNTCHVHGTVTDSNGAPQDSVNILVSAIYADSSGVFESVYTDFNGEYSVDVVGPPPNSAGFVDVSMVDCFGSLNTQSFTIFNGPSDIQADFTYCVQIIIDSCAVYIVEEWAPNGLQGLTAYTYANVPVEYLWSSGDNTQTIYPNQSGSYCVTVTFPWGCQGSDCYDYIDSLGLCYSYITSTINSDGTYFLQVYNGGVAPFTYQWNTGDTTSYLTGISYGTYCATSTDSTGCVSTTCVVLDNPIFCSVSIAPDTIGGLTAVGYGVEPLSYFWSTGQSGTTIYPPNPGVYCVTMTDTTGCSSTACYQFGIFNDSCYVKVLAFYDDSMNALALEAIPGSYGQTFSYVWSTGDSTVVIYPQDPSQTYCVTVVDNFGCVAVGCFDNSQSCYAWVDVQYVDTTTAVLTVNTDPIFGIPGWNTATYLWSDGSTGNSITVDSNGLYCVTATLGPNCVTQACGYVDFDSLQVSCSSWVIVYPDSTGQWYAEALAWGYGTFSYLWSNGDTNAITPLTSANEFLCVTATSSFGCSTESCIDTSFSPCEVYIDIQNLDSFAILKAYSYFGGATNDGTYVWDNGQTGPILTVINNGNYCVTFNSSNGCTSTACIDVFLNYADSCGVTITIDQNNPGGPIYIANPWGVPPFSYLWSNGYNGPTQIYDPTNPGLCVTVIDAAGCLSTACSPIDTLDPNNGLNVISGYVFADSLAHLKGEVRLYGLDSNTGEPMALIDSAQTGDFGFYTFKEVPTGVYVIKATLLPGTVGAAQYIPTYHLNSTTWEEATEQVIPNWLTVTTDVWMKHTSGNPGGGVIGGTVLDPHHIIAGSGDEVRDAVGVPNLEVLLKDENGEPINFMFSDADGGFKFSNLAFGTYRISYEIPGVHSPDVWVTLTPEDPERLQITLIVNQGTTAVDQPEQKELRLYPNPAKNEINIVMPEVNSNFNIQIVDMQGKVVNAGSGRSANSILSVNVDHLSPGLYHINLQGESGIYYSRFLKLD